MKKIIPAFVFLLLMLFIFLFSLKDFISAKDDDNFMKACETNSIRHNCKKVIFDSRGKFERIEISHIYSMKNMSLDTFIFKG